MKSLVILLLLTFLSGCENDTMENESLLIKGKYIKPYCDGALIEILDGNKIGTTFKDYYGTDTFKNSVVANIDTNYLKNHPEIVKVLVKDSIFYFDYNSVVTLKSNLIFANLLHLL